MDRTAAAAAAILQLFYCEVSSIWSTVLNLPYLLGPLLKAITTFSLKHPVPSSIPLLFFVGGHPEVLCGKQAPLGYEAVGFG